ncbi:hypothetical protein [Pedobacter roseus]|uniref:Uncharacterized protein n=1 Tax=Pedobacter roseus TaxID=336820 RepID=A0A7G9QHQ2_9SPHI|nr:hypothetical protein [Pedobacter roseus]QNN42877.1 hypothetical protein H9L23_01825 [Pedobacter roseus]
MRSVVYELDDCYKIVTYSKLKSGVWSATSLIKTIYKSESCINFIDALMKSLNASSKNLKEKDALSSSDYYNLLGLKKGVKIEKIAKSFTITLEGSNLSVIPSTRNNNHTYYIPQLEDKLEYSLVRDLNIKSIFTEVLKKCE